MTNSLIVPESRELFRIQDHYNNEAIAAIKNVIAQKATDHELHCFLYLANAYKLDPIRREIWFWKDEGKNRVYIMVAADGFLKSARIHPEFEGIEYGVVYEGDEFIYKPSDQTIEHTCTFKSDTIRGAWARCRRKDKPPVIEFCRWKEYVKDFSSHPSWKNNPSDMITKCAIARVCKRQFSLDGLTIAESFDPSNPQDDGDAFPTTATVTEEEPAPKSTLDKLSDKMEADKKDSQEPPSPQTPDPAQDIDIDAKFRKYILSYREAIETKLGSKFTTESEYVDAWLLVTFGSDLNKTIEAMRLKPQNCIDRFAAWYTEEQAKKQQLAGTQTDFFN